MMMTQRRDRCETNITTQVPLSRLRRSGILLMSPNGVAASFISLLHTYGTPLSSYKKSL
jgi:hypothetical protein